MNIFQRAASALRIAFGNVKQVSATQLSMFDEGKPAYLSVNFPTLVREGLRKNELIYACIDRTSRSVSQIELLVKDSKTGAVLPDHPLKRLLRRPNPLMSEYDFWQSVIIYLNLAGVAYYEKERSAAGRVVGLYPLRPDWLSPVKSSQEIISRYKYDVPGQQPVFLERQDVLAFRTFDPLDIYHGLAPAQVAARIGEIDNSATNFVKLFWEQGGVPAGILSTTQSLTDEQVTTIRKRWTARYGGYTKWLSPAVLDKDATYTRTGLTFDEIGFEALDSRNEARICMVFNIPPIIVGAAVGLERSTYSNYEEARRSWWQDSLKGLYEHLDDTINTELAPEYGDIYVEWDFGRVSALQEDTQNRWTRYREGLTAGGLTVNEFRDGVGLPPVSGGDVFIRTLNQYEVVAKPYTAPKMLQLKSATKRFDRDEREAELEKKLTGYLDGQLKRILAEVSVETGKSSKSIFDIAWWLEQAETLLSILFPFESDLASEVAREAYDNLAEQVTVGISWEMVNQAAVDWAKKYSAAQVTNITETTRKMIQQKVTDWAAGGEPLKSLEQELLGEFGEVRAKRIAATEVTSVYSQANLQTWRTTGVVESKRWMVAGGKELCDICASLDRQEVGLEEQFVDHNGDTYDAPPGHVSCRCWIQPVVRRV